MMKRLRDAVRAEEYVMMCEEVEDAEEMRRAWLENEFEEMDEETGGKGKEGYFV